MVYNFKLTVNDILQLPDFKNAKVVNDTADLTRVVEWAHILEIIQVGDLANEKKITQISDFVNDNVMIFTTGVGWKNKKDVLVFIKQLIDRNVSALCLQLGYQYKEVPQEFIKLANKHNFPIIVFYKEVRNIDIMYNLHTIFINKDYQLFLELEKFLDELNHILLAPHDLKDILSFFHNYLDVNVVYIPLQGERHFMPPLASIEQENILNLINYLKEYSPPKNVVQIANDSKFSYIEITANNNKLAYLAFFSDKKLNKMQLLALEKCNSNLAQDLLRNLFIEEKERYKKENKKWIIDWLHGLLPETQINHYLNQFEPNLTPINAVVCIMSFANSQENNISLDFMLHMTIIARPFFKQHGLYILNYFNNNQIAFIILDTSLSQTCEERITKSINELKRTIEGRSTHLNNLKLTFSLGKVVNKLKLLNRSFITAKETLSVQQKAKHTDILFYNNLHIYRIIPLLDKQDFINELITDYLQPIIEYDHQHDGKLIQTLKVFLECNCNKQETAQRLYVVRQTLYNRIQKIEELLGTDFLLPEKRVMIEIALYTYDYLNI
ncbi:purine catabolism regulatory protein [Desulfonispora thiosulfatigenes DSM 11270]|uniref:Purine catabolism regulatory protein n=1 Tax=Desulfonispora thiosulfatigenes DSM 11270 TaxID=656914 RepID=A0A1W1VFW2_DESTI|nr:PucR family transcriptional regulator [Desulfonispora thiosulfatigenes]SMB92242.1 purine catabolism regulatory protein [Desulfonispora thiosulfatigenes DSM 11270]